MIHLIKSTVAVLLLFLIHPPNVYSQSDPSDSLRVGFLGIHTENIDQNYFQDIDRRFYRQITRFEDLSSFRISVDEFDLIEMNENSVRQLLPELSDSYRFDYLIGGKFNHISDTDEVGFLNGRIFRYDRAEDRFYFLNIRTAYLDLDQSTNRFREQFVETIQPEPVSDRASEITKWTLIVLGSAAVIAGAIMLYNSVGSGGEGDPGAPRPTPFHIR